MITRYFVEADCEHGNQGICDHLPTDDFDCMRLDCDVFHDEPCPGGSRRELVGTIETVGEPGYYDHHGNDGAFVAPGRYLVILLEEPASG